MMKFLVILSLLALEIFASNDYCKSFSSYEHHWVLEFETPGERDRHYQIFQATCSEINDHQDLFAHKLVSYNLTANKFVGRDPEDLKNLLCRTIQPVSMRAMPAPKKATVYPAVPAAYAKARNWCYLHNAPRDQQSCGACWAFSTIAVIEACLNRNWGNQVSLSEQMLIDCSTDNIGCDGGWPTLAMNYANDYGLCSNSYLYQNSQGKCATRKFRKVISPNTFIRINEEYINGDEEKLKKIVCKNGPISAVIVVASEMFIYGGGVFMCDTCDKENLNHAVVICGYGLDPNFGPYWIVRNSWGSSWGENGYIKIAMGRNTCGIASYAMWVEM